MLIAAGDCGVVYSCTFDHTHDNIYQAHPPIFDEGLEVSMDWKSGWLDDPLVWEWDWIFWEKCEKYIPDAEDVFSYVSLDQLLNNTYA